jgi:hypothetical protein
MSRSSSGSILCMKLIRNTVASKDRTDIVRLKWAPKNAALISTPRFVLLRTKNDQIKVVL